MAVRQYIGARYVTKIYENSIDPSSAEWEAGVTYEPLTLVTYLNSSYLSKKEVPGSVGDPASNPSYWVVTGAYNGQIAQLQNDIQNVRDEIDGVVDSLYLNENSKVLCVGDSYGVLGSTPWPSIVKNILNLDNDHFTNTCALGSGFLGSNSTAVTYLEQLMSIQDPETYTHIVIAGGFNDAYRADGSTATITSAFSAVANYIKTNFVNAVNNVYIGFMGYCSDKGTDLTKAIRMRQVCSFMSERYQYFCEQYHFNWLTNLPYVLHSKALFSDYVAYDCVFHPSDLGNEYLARAIVGGMSKSPVNTILYGNAAITTDSTRFSSNLFTSAVDYYKDGQTLRTVKGSNAVWTASSSVSTTDLTWNFVRQNQFKLGDISDATNPVAFGSPDVTTYAPCAFRSNDSGTQVIHNCSAKLFFNGNDLMCQLLTDSFNGYIDSLSFGSASLTYEYGIG